MKHKPIAPTPGPPHAVWAWRARPRSQTVTGLVPPPAKARNSALTQARRTTSRPPSTVGKAPSVPNREGTWTVKPASRTQRASRRTSGLMPGISGSTTTAGPVPATYTVFATPSTVTLRRVKSVIGSLSFMGPAWSRGRPPGEGRDRQGQG
ncbi:hypothetical protein GCM10010260_60330 [Streptomyces filipinensis]|uniref:Uncharacterized protein n=1 Tax=Streptomyces filipinensis TaxID=66887 RepID=A0A918IGT8_9ACTN|nr:hypothetical protein GCM10010260_60330 [Streptomyces filipinensis]